MSICLAEDIASEKHKTIIQLMKAEKNPLIIFTDVYTDDESEFSSELLNRAKAINAVCIKNDVSEISLKSSKSVTYLLIDRDDSGSISSFSDLLKNDKTRPKSKKAIKKLRMTATLDGEYTINERDFLRNISFSLSSTDMFGNKVPLYDINGAAVSADDFKTHAVKCKVKQTKDHKTKINIYFNFSSKALDSTKPFLLVIDNIQSLIPHVNKKNIKYTFNIPDLPTWIFLFVQNDCHAEIANRLYFNSKEKTYQVGFRVIRDYKNAATNLMSQVPLFMPLLYKKPNNRSVLNVTIFGGGCIAQEVFKAVYWCGQIPNVELNITVLTKDDIEFKNSISVACPELLDSCEEGSTLLSVFSHDPTIVNTPYVKTLDIKSVPDVRNINAETLSVIRKTDYFVIALGSDEEAVEMTNILCRELTKIKLIRNKANGSIIVPAIFNRDIADAIANKKPSNLITETYVIPFAMLDERFSCETAFMENHIATAFATAELYNREHQVSQQKDEYTYWSNIAKAMHAPYKLFGLGRLRLAHGKRTAITGVPDDMYRIDKKPLENTPENNEDLQQAWVEHRRWNAFMRAQGFRCLTETEFETYTKIKLSQKDTQLKLHSCLVECSPTGTEPLPDTTVFDRRKYDRLDYVSMMVHKAKLDKDPGYFGTPIKNADYKQYDFVEFDDTIKKLLGYPED